MYVHALHTVHALPDLRTAGGRLGGGVFIRAAILFSIGCAVVAYASRSKLPLLAAFPSSSLNPSAVLNVTLRDSLSGLFISSALSLRDKDGKIKRLSTDKTGRGRFQITPGLNDFEVAAAGYEVLRTHFDFVDASELSLTLWLDRQSHRLNFELKLSK